MALPILETPKYTLTVPSTGATLEYRPFLVKEEKVLLIAQESDSQEEMLKAPKDVIRSCTFDKCDPNKLTSFDLEYVLLKLRSKSVGEIANINVKCSKCNHSNPIEVDLDSIAIECDTDLPRIMLTDTVGITLRYIRVKDLGMLTKDNKKTGDLITDSIIASIDTIFDDKGVYKTDDTPKNELAAFVGSLNRAQMNKIEDFIANTPRLEKTVSFKCSNAECNAENEVVLAGIKTFFE
jgi:hypothetical protein